MLGRARWAPGVTQLLQHVRVAHQVGLYTKQQVRRELLCMGPDDQSPSLPCILSRLAHTGYTRQFCLLQGSDEPLPPRFLVQHIPILEIAAIAEFRCSSCGEIVRSWLGLMAQKKLSWRCMPKRLSYPTFGNEEPSASRGERIRQRGNRNHPDIVHAEPSTRKRHVVAGIQVEILELKPPGRRLTFLRIAVRKPALFTR